MTDREFISDIKNRFRFTAKDIRGGLTEYEMKLIYDTFPKEPHERIKDVLKGYASGTLKLTRTSPLTKNMQKKNINRGVLPGTLII